MRHAADRSRSMFIAVFCGSVLLPLASFAADSSAPVQAGWKTQEIRYSYTGFTTAYDCDAAEDRIKAILKALGAHEQTRVSAQGCKFNRPSRNFFITITTATPVPVADLSKSPAQTSRDELLKRLGVAAAQLDETFPAEWKTVELSRDRKLDLEPGDCELMEGLRDHVLPKLLGEDPGRPRPVHSAPGEPSNAGADSLGPGASGEAGRGGRVR